MQQLEQTTESDCFTVINTASTQRHIELSPTVMKADDELIIKNKLVYLIMRLIGLVVISKYFESSIHLVIRMSAVKR